MFISSRFCCDIEQTGTPANVTFTSADTDIWSAASRSISSLKDSKSRLLAAASKVSRSVCDLVRTGQQTYRTYIHTREPDSGRHQPHSYGNATGRLQSCELSGASPPVINGEMMVATIKTTIRASSQPHSWPVVGDSKGGGGGGGTLQKRRVDQISLVLIVAAV